MMGFPRDSSCYIFMNTLIFVIKNHHMKKVIILSLILVTLFGCNGNSQEQKLKEQREAFFASDKAEVNFFKEATPKNFSAQTVDGSLFNSKENNGKYWVVFVYSKNYLTKSVSYDLVKELNETHKKYGSKFPMIGVVTGYSESEVEMKKKIDSANFRFKQIDNCAGPDQDKKFKENVFCEPAKILIDPKGKVVYHGCGGNTKTFNILLDSLIHTNKM